jgi:hypothetical protein
MDGMWFVMRELGCGVWIASFIALIWTEFIKVCLKDAGANEIPFQPFSVYFFTNY